MMLFLTGATSSLSKSGGNSPQGEISRSLGGFVSSSPAPSGAINSMFDLISSLTIEKMQKETIAISLVNKFAGSVKNVTLKVIGKDSNLAEFKVSAVKIGKEMYMEKLNNRYQEPIQSEFYDASFSRAGVNVKVVNPAVAGEEIVIYPFDVDVTVSESGLEGTLSAIEAAFDYGLFSATRISNDTVRIERLDEEVIPVPVTCSFISTDNVVLEFATPYENKIDNTVILVPSDGELKSEEAIGIWIQRIIKKSSKKTNAVMVQEYKDGVIQETVEQVEFVFSYEMTI